MPPFTSLLRRRCRYPLPFLHSSSPSHSLLSTSSIHRHTNNITSSPSHLRSISPHNFLSLSRSFSSHPPLPLPDHDLILPLKALISLLDSYHHVSGFPWWIVISSSTVAMRLGLFPMHVLQLKKLKTISELLPTLPPPFPPPLSGRSFRDQIALFLKQKKAAGCPSVFWFFSSFAVQVPFFFLWIMSIRRMSLDNHPGFDSGGILWFENLTEFPNGMLGPIFPLIIAGLHFTNVQISFQKSSLQDVPGMLGLLTKVYRIYLQLLTLPILIATFNVPQGSLVYWLTNSSLSLIQQLCLRNPSIREFLGVHKPNAAVAVPTKIETDNSTAADILIRTKEGPILARSLSPAELISYSIKTLADGRVDTAIKALRLALEKEPGNARALLIMGQTLLQKEQFADAVECLETAISKLLEAGYPTEVEKVDHLILSSTWAGIANVRLGKMEKGLQHLERIAQQEEPEDSKSKAHYYDGLLVLSSALLNVDRKAEALKYMQKAAAYNPDYNTYIEQLETDSGDFTRDLENSRREF